MTKRELRALIEKVKATTPETYTGILTKVMLLNSLEAFERDAPAGEIEDIPLRWRRDMAIFRAGIAP
jgi:hypothetical protein